MSILTGRGERVSDLVDALGGQTRVPRVNLMPPEITAGRAFRRTQKALAAGVCAVVLAAGGVYALQVRDANTAAEELATERATGAVLLAEQAKYAEVPRVLATIDAAETARQSAMGQDVEWYRYLSALSLSTPSHVWLTSLDMSLSTGVAAAPVATGVAPAAPAVATLSFQATGLEHPDVATWLDALTKQPAVTDPTFTAATKGRLGTHDIVTFGSTAGLDQAALSHRFDRKAP